MASPIPTCCCGTDPTFHTHETMGRVRWAATITCRVSTCRANASGVGSTRRKAGKTVRARWVQIFAERRAQATRNERTAP